MPRRSDHCGRRGLNSESVGPSLFLCRRRQNPQPFVHAHTLNDDVIALAGIFQAVDLVRQAAQQGGVDNRAFQSSIESVFRLDAESAGAVFGGVSNLTQGLRTLSDHLGRRLGSPNTEITGYVIALMFLERKLIRAPSMLDSLRRGIGSVESLHRDTPRDPSVISALGQLYSDTISQLNPKILVHGAPVHLNDTATANRIRALLLAGMRATVLWRQVGGSRIGLLFGRKRAVAAAERALRQMDTEI